MIPDFIPPKIGDLITLDIEGEKFRAIVTEIAVNLIKPWEFDLSFLIEPQPE